jgi:hypothetical protein
MKPVKDAHMLAEHFSAYTQWRGDVASGIGELRKWLQLNEIGDAQSDLRLQYLLDRLREDKLIVAFVAEFSRGKSELINAVFFAGYGNRILPSSAGRTTMCPTELQWKEGDKPEIRLLPIESRKTNASITELKRYPEEWQIRPLDTSSAESLQQALAQVGETRLASQAEAEELGFPIDASGDHGIRPDSEGKLEIPRWRHAIIQFPHPLLEQGLVILDTPGLNAIGAEPELTLNLLPNAHAVLFILAADTGVTQSDLAVWRELLAGWRRPPARGAWSCSTKIDGLWDGLRRRGAHRALRSAARSTRVAATLGVDRGAGVSRVRTEGAGSPSIQGDDAELLAIAAASSQLERALCTKTCCRPSRRSCARTPWAMSPARWSAATRALLEAPPVAACASNSRNSPTCAARTRASSNT